MIWSLTNIKSLLSNRLFYIVSISMLLLCSAISSIKPTVNNDTVAVFISKNKAEMSSLIDALKNDRDVLIYDDEEMMKQDVYDGKVIIAYSIHADAYDYIVLKEDRNIVDVYVSPGYLYGEVDKERFYNAWLYYCSNTLISDEADNVFSESDDNLKDDLIRRKDGYLSGESLFDINIIEEENPLNASSSATDPIRSVIAFSVFITIFILYGHSYSGQGFSIDRCMPLRSRTIYRFVASMSQGIIIGVIGLICLYVFSSYANLKDIFQMIFFVLICVLWTLIMGALIRKEDTYTAVCPVIITLQLILCPVIIDLNNYMPLIGYLRYLFPVTYFLSL